MSTHKHIDKICCVVLAITLILKPSMSLQAQMELYRKSLSVIGLKTHLAMLR